MGHVTRRLSAYAEGDQFVVRPERAVEKEAIGDFHDSFDFGTARADAGGIPEAWPTCRLAHEQRDVVVDLRRDLIFQVERHLSGNWDRRDDQLAGSLIS